MVEDSINVVYPESIRKPSQLENPLPGVGFPLFSPFYIAKSFLGLSPLPSADAKLM